MSDTIYGCDLAKRNTPAKCNHFKKIGKFCSCELPTKKHLATKIIKDACEFIGEYSVEATKIEDEEEVVMEPVA